MTRPAGMSFTGEVIAELAPHVPILACCRAALVGGMRLAGGGGPAPAGGVPPGGTTTLLTTTRPAAARVALAALHAAAIPARLERRRTAGRATYALAGDPAALPPVPDGRPCCDRALVRGAFLRSGAVNRPDAAPHAEIVARDADAAVPLVRAMTHLGIDAVVASRRGRTVVLVRSTDGVAALLSGIGAQGGRLRFEEGRVVREVRGGVNRRINSETANLRRTVDAGLAQSRAAARLQRDGETWARLPAALREAALLRHRHPHDTLEALAARGGVSRSAMAGRLRRLMEVAAGAPRSSGMQRPI